VFSTLGHQVPPVAPVMNLGPPRAAIERRPELRRFEGDRVGHPTGARIFGNPLRSPDARAWLERAQPDTLTPVVWPLSGPRVTIGREAQADVVVPDFTARPIHLVLQGRGGPRWCLAPVDANDLRFTSDEPPLLRGARLLVGQTPLIFECSGAPEVTEHAAALDQAPRDENAWLVWADQLKERGDRLGDLLCEKRHSESELDEQLGALAPLHRLKLVGLEWNRFAFLAGLSVSVEVLRRHRFMLDAAWVPAVRHLARLTITGEVDDTELAALLERCVLPRSLHALRYARGAPPTWLLTGVQPRCPHLA
jgi:hypothetical protein